MAAAIQRTLRTGASTLAQQARLALASHTRCSLGQRAPQEGDGGAIGSDRAADATATATRKMDKPLAPPGRARTFYMRQLPTPPAIEFASERGEPPQQPDRQLAAATAALTCSSQCICRQRLGGRASTMMLCTDGSGLE